MKNFTTIGRIFFGLAMTAFGLLQLGRQDFVRLVPKLPLWIAQPPGWAVASGGLLFPALVFAFSRRMKKAHFGWLSIVRGFAGLPMFAYLLLRSQRAYKRSRFDWKDRTYVYTPEEVKAMSGARSASGSSGS